MTPNQPDVLNMDTTSLFYSTGRARSRNDTIRKYSSRTRPCPSSNVNFIPLLSKITAPVLGIYPAGGVITTDEHFELLRTHVKKLCLIRVPSAAHGVQIVQPALVATAVLHFIAAHDGITCHE